MRMRLAHLFLAHEEAIVDVALVPTGTSKSYVS
jgi:hypothetical protein